MDRDLSPTEGIELTALLFLHGMALASWFVPMGAVLESAQLRWLIPFAFAASATAALLSPLFFGAMADRSVPPIRVLRWLQYPLQRFTPTPQHICPTWDCSERAHG